jgi:hypothetical protein
MGSFPGNKTNYTLIGKQEKEKRHIDNSRSKQIRECIIRLLKEDCIFWENKNQKQPGIERLNLLQKVCSLEPSTNVSLFDFLLEGLEVEQIVLPIKDENLTRYIYLVLGEK